MSRPLPLQVTELSDGQRDRLLIYLCGAAANMVARALADLGYDDTTYEASLLPETPAPERPAGLFTPASTPIQDRGGLPIERDAAARVASGVPAPAPATQPDMLPAPTAKDGQP